jgi:hypothetical protein
MHEKSAMNLKCTKLALCCLAAMNYFGADILRAVLAKPI